MERVIKFKVWDTEEKKWFKPVYDASNGRLLDLSVTLSGELMRRTLTMPAEHVSIFPHKYLLVEYTGLQDKNNVEAYNGNTLKHPDYGNGVICWCSSEAAYILDFNEGGGELLEDWMFTMQVLKECEITGHIHEPQVN